MLDLKGRPQTGVAGVTFSLYKDPIGGVPVWTETQNVTLDEYGRYKLDLHVDEQSVRSGQARWFGVQVAEQQEQPRRLFSAVLAQQQPEFTVARVYFTDSPVAGVGGDFNQDGVFDLATSFQGLASTGVAVLLGNPDGSFHSPTYYNCGGGAVGVGDFNGDGKFDIVALNQGIVGGNPDGSFCVLLGNGDGTFQSPLMQNLGGNLSSVAVSDFNNDGKSDLAITDLANNRVYILLGNGSGSFLLIATYSFGSPVSLAAGDLNGDGKLDLLVASNTSGNIGVLLGTGNGTFFWGGSPSVGGVPSSITVADFNGDSRTDVAVAIPSGDRVGVLFGKGDGNFQPFVSYAAGSNPFFVTTADLNRDGKSDLAVVSATGTSVLLNTGNGSFGPPVTYGSDLNPVSVLTHDFDSDGNTDLAVLCRGDGYHFTGGVAVLSGNGDGSFLGAVNYAVGNNPVSAAIADLNLDGKPDIAVATQDGVSVLLAKPSGALFDAPVTYGKNASFVATADLNNDGKPDLIILNGGNIGVLLGNGDGTFDSEVDYAVNAISFVTGDFNGDGKLDAAAVNSRGITVLLGKGDGTFGQLVTTPVAGPDQTSTQGIVTAADFNGDGKLDLAFIGPGGTTVLLGYGNGTFSVRVTYGVGRSQVRTGDLNHDGIQDLVVSDTGSNTVSVLMGNGDGTFRAPVTYSSGIPSSVAAADIDGDGALDLAVADTCPYGMGCGYGGYVSVFPGKGDGTFTSAAGYRAGSYPLWVSISDLNQDGAVDIVAVNNLYGSNVPSNNTITVFSNLGGTFINLSSSPNPSQVGQEVTLNATVVGSVTPAIRPAVTGNITFKDGNSILGTSKLRAGSAVLTISNLDSGMHSISAFYSGDSNFNPHSSGALGQTVSDFALALAQRVSTVIPGQTASYLATITPQNGFDKPVSLSCSGLWSGTSCSFVPGSVDLSGGSATAVVNVTTVRSLALGSYTITLSGTSGSTQHAVALTLKVANFSISASPSSVATVPGQSSIYNLSLNAVSGVSDTVLLSCSGVPTGTNCSFNPPAVTLGANAASSTLTVTAGNTTAPGVYALTVSASSSAGSNQSSAVITLSVGDFSLSVSPVNMKIAAGQSATYALSIAGQYSFTNAVSLTCSIPAQGSKCSLNPASVTPGANPAISKLTISTTGSTALTSPFAPWSLPPAYALGLPFAGMALMGVGLAGRQGPQKKTSKAKFVLISVVLLTFFAIQAGCGGGGGSTQTTIPPSGATPAGTYTVTIIAKSGSLQHSVTGNLTVR